MKKNEQVQAQAARRHEGAYLGEVLILAFSGKDFVTDDDQTEAHETFLRG